MTDEERKEIDDRIEEGRARIRDMNNRADLADVDRQKRLQDIALAPKSLVTALGAGAALFGAGAAFATAIGAAIAIALRH